MTIIEKQKYDLAKFLRLIFLVPPKENTSSRIKPIKGIENKNNNNDNDDESGDF